VDEVRDAIRGRRRGDCPAPGPDGLSLTIWKCAPSSVVECLSPVFYMPGEGRDSWRLEEGHFG